MTGDKTRRVLVTVVAALVLVIGGAFAASGQIGALHDRTTSASPSNGPVTDDATDAADDATDETTGDETDQDETTGDETTGDETTGDETTDDETDAATEAEDDEAPAVRSGGEDTDAKETKAACALTSPPNRAVGGDDADRHPGWSTGKHLGWCVAAAHHDPTGRPAKPGSVDGGKHVDKPARPAVKAPKKPHPGKDHAKRH